MDFSRPDNARKINTLKVLSTIREKKNMTRAELSRELLINKVSISEIVATLVDEGLVKETGKTMADSGRPATTLDISATGSIVLGLDISGKGANLAASDLKGRILRLEHFARGKSDEELKENLGNSIDRITRHGSVSVLAMAVVSDDDVDFLKKEFLFPVMTVPAIEAQVRAEMIRSGKSLENMLFISIGDRIDAAIRRQGETVHLARLGKMRISKGRVDADGEEGTLEAFFSGNAFRSEAERLFSREYTNREILTDGKAVRLIFDGLKALAASIALAVEVLDADSVMIVGTYAEMPDEYYARVNTLVMTALPKSRKDAFVFKSLSLDKGRMEGACHMALDEFFYKTRLLERLRRLESLDC